MVAAPPCRTFSLARTMPGGPPPVRDRQFPAGMSPEAYAIDNFSATDIAKVFRDNVLVERTAEACEILASQDIGFVIEQPWPWKKNVPVMGERGDLSDIEEVVVTDLLSAPRAQLSAAPSTAQLSSCTTLRAIRKAIDEMTVTDQERYNRTCREGDRFQNGISEMLGLNIAGGISKVSRLNPHLFPMIMAWLRDQEEYAYFQVTSVHVNRNLLAQPHRDTANEGDSLLVVFGEFLGGELLLWQDDDGSLPIDVLVERQKPAKQDAKSIVRFNGCQAHATEAFIGVRYSLVFFVVKGAANASGAVQRQLVSEGALCNQWVVQAA